MPTLRSHVSGGWYAPADGRPLHDAVTGEEVARISSDGVDFAGALSYGRTVGGRALRELTFHQRAALLKALGQHLREHREELYAVSAQTGATLGDSKFDVDGGIGVLLAYASKAKRELPNDTVYVEGDIEPLGRGGTFLGQHVCTPLHGVAVQVNAFNFPVWGPLEKFAPAFLAGVPSIVKPASPTAFLTAKLTELIVGSGLLPDGTWQFVAGSVGDLFDHLTGQDLVSFTGSASTAQTLRAHPAIVRNSVRFSAEADSLNLSALGPDAVPGTEEFDLFVKGLTTEMTVKAGQKCTAIRRAFVPAEHVDAVVEAASARLAKVTVGDPATARMGALASLEQREEVRRSIKALADAGRIVFGDPDSVQVENADADRGAFVSPILLVGDPERAEPHEVEAFGPVSTILPYTSTEQLIDYAARGQGSLAGSIVTADPAWAREVVLGVAPWHGRLLVLNARDAKESTGHGSPMPQLVHGGPGRAGGGEEMGGIRGVLHHMQRTAIQGDPDTLAAVTGRWVTGAQRRETDVHPFRKHLEELRPGDTIVAGPRTVTQEDVEHFAEFTGDTFYAHMDAEAAAANPLFGERVAHGYLIVSLAAGLFVDPDPGPVLANFGVDRLRFLTPVKFGDALTVTLTCKQLTPRDSADYGEVRWDADVTRQDGESVARYDVLTLVAKQASA
ncbi:phenylacetic acid degradation bifunctional protein PaaZ [Pseudonocardia abyssalis]|uniref:Phenylacetic acid degradation bifunctional protein PaaZ n=1 Tax=Pseudonocardia abyssalis TaxID=2792008 RepID=A0ABS6UR94_9PSEU|nr:phenylacetic acid degradation bifunctional protein PaaZ [Pseudonocardia abyssalis]MBW0117688.1 phenylacetic acid degradation bifunctional protein PaaZ [Pseudonocardia abyssalis]MBW0134781.1 phenylacetic acid degradation bifunctional protein PaaZ [Pseudonocardia abyssalis]